MKMWKILLAIVTVVAIVVAVVGFITEDRLSDFAKNLLAGVFSVLLAFLLAWLFFEKPASTWLGRIGTLLERDEQYQRSVKQSWAKTVLLPLALILLEVTHQVVHDLQGIEDDIFVPSQESISQQANKVWDEVSAFFQQKQNEQIGINRAAASSLSQTYKLLDRLEAYLASGPDWIRGDAKIVEYHQEASRRAIDSLPLALVSYSNIHPMSRRVRVSPQDFGQIVVTAHSTSLQLYLEELTGLARALNDKVHREGLD